MLSSEKYIGETGRNIHTRMKEHMNDVRMKRELSAMEALQRDIANREQYFKCNIRRVYGNDVTLRKITEEVDIRRERAGSYTIK